MAERSPDRYHPLGLAAIACAVAALVLAGSPWLGGAAVSLDALAPAWPVAAMLSVAALAGARPRSLTAVIALCAIALCIPMIVAVPRPIAAGTGLRLVIVTHNVWVANVDPGPTAAALATSGADIVLLQETEGRFAPYLATLANVFPYANACPRKCSLAIFSRYPLDRVRYRFRDNADDPIGPGLIQTGVHLPGGIVAPIATIHLPRGAPHDANRLRRLALAAAVRRTDTRSLILAGDFNLVPWSVRMRQLDAWLAPLRRTTAIFSFPARVQGRSFPMPLVPIDHLYAGPNWAMTAARRLPRTGSDHYPVRVDLIWQGGDAMITKKR